MASRIKSSFVFILFIINVIGVTIIYLVLYYYTYDTKKRKLKEIEKIKLKHNNLKITNQILLNNKKINPLENLHNNTYPNSNKDKVNNNLKVKLTKRRLSYRFINDFYFVIMLLNSLSAFFCLIVLFSFFVKNDDRINCCYRSTSGFHFLCFGYYLISFIILNFIMILKCVSLMNDTGNDNIYSKNILIISAVLLIFNILGVLLPNLKCFKILRYEPNNKIHISLRGSSIISKSGVNNLVKSISNNIVVENNSNYNNNNAFPMAPEQNSEKNENITNSFSANNKSKIIEKSTNVEDISLSVTRRDFTSDRKSIGNIEESTKI